MLVSMDHGQAVKQTNNGRVKQRCIKGTHIAALMSILFANSESYPDFDP